MEEIIETVDTVEELLPVNVVRQGGKSVLNALFLQAMIGKMRYDMRKPGKHHKARVLRAQARRAKIARKAR